MNGLNRYGLGGACIVGLAIFVSRLTILRRRAGVWAITYLRRPGQCRVETAIGVAWVALLVGIPSWVAVYAWRGPDGLGVFDLGPWARGIGWILLGAGGLLVAVAEVHMGTSWRVGIDDSKTVLVTDGAFRFVRNPIYTGMVISIADGLLVAPSLLGGAVCAATAVGVALQARLEERHLLALHGETYQHYARSVGRFVPRLGRMK